MKKRTEIVAHRGYSGIAPENTRASIEAALAGGAKFIEGDFWPTRDRCLALSHDPDLLRCAGVPKNIGDLDFEDLGQYDVGSWKDPRFSDQRILSLPAVLRMTMGKAVYCAEFKTPGVEKELAKAMAETGATAEHLEIFGWDRATLGPIHALDPALKITFLAEAPEGKLERGKLFDDAKACGARTVGIDHRAIDASLVRDAHALGLEVYAWTVNEPTRMGELAAMGVDRIITDQLKRAQDELKPASKA